MAGFLFRDLDLTVFLPLRFWFSSYSSSCRLFSKNRFCKGEEDCVCSGLDIMQYCCILLRSVLPCSTQDVKSCILSLEAAMVAVTMKWNARNFAMASMLCEKCVVRLLCCWSSFSETRIVCASGYDCERGLRSVEVSCHGKY
jgi:hypothetical protein